MFGAFFCGATAVEHLKTDRWRVNIVEAGGTAYRWMRSARRPLCGGIASIVDGLPVQSKALVESRTTEKKRPLTRMAVGNSSRECCHKRNLKPRPLAPSIFLKVAGFSSLNYTGGFASLTSFWIIRSTVALA